MSAIFLSPPATDRDTRTLPPLLKATMPSSPHHPVSGGAPRRRSPEPLLNPSQASVALRVSADELLAMVNEGELPAYNLDGLIRFRPDEVRTLALDRGW